MLGQFAAESQPCAFGCVAWALKRIVLILTVFLNLIMDVAGLTLHLILYRTFQVILFRI